MARIITQEQLGKWPGMKFSKVLYLKKKKKKGKMKERPNELRV